MEFTSGYGYTRRVVVVVVDSLHGDSGGSDDDDGVGAVLLEVSCAMAAQPRLHHTRSLAQSIGRAGLREGVRRGRQVRRGRSRAWGVC